MNRFDFTSVFMCVCVSVQCADGGSQHVAADREREKESGGAAGGDAV